jgi:hypothetical protein
MRYGKATDAKVIPKNIGSRLSARSWGDQAAPRESFNGEAAGREATRAYDNHAKKFSESGQVTEKVKEAEAALDGPEREELKRAEEVGKRRARNAA